MKENTGLRKTTLAALFLAIGLILPFITMQIPAVGKMLCPMHIPVLLCGYVCGWPYGLIVGIITPLYRLQHHPFRPEQVLLRILCGHPHQSL